MSTERSSAPQMEWAMGRELFERRMPHHDGIKALWETKWAEPCLKGVYPFHDGRNQDFVPVFEHLIKNNINDGTSVKYTEAFFPAAEKLLKKADVALASGNATTASDFYLRAASIYRIARFPYITSFPEVNCPVKWRAWTAQKEAYMSAADIWVCPVEDIAIPHVHRSETDRPSIPVYVRVPQSAGREKPCPVVILITGLDGYRPDNTTRSNEILSRGCASLAVEVPGTADCPADPSDPESPDRLWSSVLDWLEADGRFDMKRVLVWGLSTGGYYAVRSAYTHSERLLACVGQGAGVHHFFDEEWLGKADGHEYPFLLTPAMAMKHGYASVDKFKAEAQKSFSLLESGILEKQPTKLLLVNGTADGLMPIEDSKMLISPGKPVEGRFVPGALHMGYPAANALVYEWIDNVLEQSSK